MKNKVKVIRRSQIPLMSQSKLAEAVQVSRETISSIEKGGSTSIEIALRISDVFNMDPREIFFTHDVAQNLHDENNVAEETGI